MELTSNNEGFPACPGGQIEVFSNTLMEMISIWRGQERAQNNDKGILLTKCRYHYS